MLIWQVVVQPSWTYLPPICASYLLRSQTPCQDGLHQGAWRDHHQCVPRHSGQISQSGDVRQRQPQNGMDILEGNGSEITSHLSFLASSTAAATPLAASLLHAAWWWWLLAWYWRSTKISGLILELLLKSISIMGSLFSLELTSDLSSFFEFSLSYHLIIIIQLCTQFSHFRIQACWLDV